MAIIAAACGGGPELPVAQPRSDTELVVGGTSDFVDDEPGTPDEGVETHTPTPPREVPAGAVLISPDSIRTPIDRRVFGTNLPAWAGPELLADPAFHQLAKESGTTLIRMPGGSWSNLYDWLACERRDADGCYWTWAARPSDFIGFLRDTGLEGMWTVSINETAQNAAAAVSFFNGEVDDETIIGVDRNGVDWGTVGQWAELRTQNGHPAPVGLDLWEVGNEVFGGKPSDGGAECAEFGWEEVWTCDGTEYIQGTDNHDGALAIRQAMLAVDPTIEVGMVGTGVPSNWSNFGNEVIEGSGAALDFYVVHFYGFDRAAEGQVTVERAVELWPTVIDAVREELATEIPIAVTEYNLVSNEVNDAEHTMTQTMNALFFADTLGQLIEAGIPIANQWNLANGRTSSGTDYGLVDIDDGETFPAFDALALWARTGDDLLDTFGDVDELVRVYPTRHADGRLTIMLLGLSSDAQEQTIVIDGAPDDDATWASVWSDNLTATAWAGTRLENPTVVDETITIEIPPWSISILEIPAP